MTNIEVGFIGGLHLLVKNQEGYTTKAKVQRRSDLALERMEEQVIESSREWGARVIR